MIRVLTLLCLVFCLVSTAKAQDRKLEQAAKNGRPLRTQITVTNNVTAQAVLIPRIDARRIFGKEIADNYAVIEVNVGNKSADAALIIHGIFIDYTRWALSGTPNLPSSLDGIERDSSSPWQAATSPNQVASEEYRVVRGQLLDAQMWSKRNWTVRLMTFAGQLASAYAFSLSEDGIIRGLNAFSGSVVPGLKEVWPDGTIDQLNRVSDFGYQANKVIPQQGAEVIVCFFPIDRFLTPGFKQLFLKSPALFFAPLQMLVDTSLEPSAKKILTSINPELTVPDLRKSMPCYLRVVQQMRFGQTAYDNTLTGQLSKNADEACWDAFGLEAVEDVTNEKTATKDNKVLLRIKGGATSPKDENLKKFRSFLALNFISQMSLNTVSVTIDGVMTVDTTTIPGKIDAIAFDRLDCGGSDEPCFWGDTETAGGVRTGTLDGSYFTGGELVITEAEKLGITEVKTLDGASTDQRVQFSFKLTKAIAPDTKLHFTIRKPQPGSAATLKTVDGLPREYLVHYSLPHPHVTDVKQEGRTLTITGENLLDLPLVVKLHPPFGKEVTVEHKRLSETKLEVTIPDDAAPAGCWYPVIYRDEVAETRPDADCFCFSVAPKPTLTSATRQTNTILVEGTDLIDTSGCQGSRISFQLVKEGGTPIGVGLPQLAREGDRALLALPKAAKEGSWKVRVLLDGKKVENQEVTLEGP